MNGFVDPTWGLESLQSPNTPQVQRMEPDNDGFQEDYVLFRG